MFVNTSEYMYMFYSNMHQSEEFVPPSSGEESENENFESVLLNQVSSASKLLEQVLVVIMIMMTIQQLDYKGYM